MRYSSAILTIALLFAPGPAFAESLRDRIVENHYSYIPAGTGRFATLIAAPGCSGISSGDSEAEAANPLLSEDDRLFRRHYRQIVEKLKTEAFAVLLLDINSAEDLLTACNRQIAAERSAMYINEAIAWAKELPFVDSQNIHLIGWSMGGNGVLKWLHGPRSESSSVRSVVAVYPNCRRHSNLTIGLPTLVLLGGSDDIADPLVCEDLVRSVPTRDGIKVVNYPGARHGFDIRDAPPVLDIGNGRTIGFQREAADASWLAILEFLRKAH